MDDSIQTLKNEMNKLMSGNKSFNGTFKPAFAVKELGVLRGLHIKTLLDFTRTYRGFHGKGIFTVRVYYFARRKE